MDPINLYTRVIEGAAGGEHDTCRQNLFGVPDWVPLSRVRVRYTGNHLGLGFGLGPAPASEGIQGTVII